MEGRASNTGKQSTETLSLFKQRAKEARPDRLRHAHHQYRHRSRSLPGQSGGRAEPAKVVPDVIIISDQDDKSSYRAAPSWPSAGETTASFKAEMAARGASTTQDMGLMSALIEFR